jgi:hypothetical protein
MNDRREILIEKYIEPSKIEIFRGIIVQRWFDRNYDLHSFMGHSSEIRHSSGEISYQAWYKKGVEHRDKNLPSAIEYKDEQTIVLIYKKNGVKVKCEIKNPDLGKWF